MKKSTVIMKKSDMEYRRLKVIISGGGTGGHIFPALSIAAKLKEVNPETEILFVRRYVYLESVADLAKRFDMAENRVAVKLYRARKKLKKYLEKEGIKI